MTIISDPQFERILKRYNEGQNIFRRESVTVLLQRIEALERVRQPRTMTDEEYRECLRQINENELMLKLQEENGG